MFKKRTFLKSVYISLYSSKTMHMKNNNYNSLFLNCMKLFLLLKQMNMNYINCNAHEMCFEIVLTSVSGTLSRTQIIKMTNMQWWDNVLKSNYNMVPCSKIKLYRTLFSNQTIWYLALKSNYMVPCSQIKLYGILFSSQILWYLIIYQL